VFRRQQLKQTEALDTARLYMLNDARADARDSPLHIVRQYR
jgi:hypothetical protein